MSGALKSLHVYLTLWRYAVRNRVFLGYTVLNMRNLNSKSGFTLVELLVSIAIIGVLVSVIAIAAGSVRSKGRDAQVRSDKQQIILALVRARETSPSYLYPGTGTGWRCLKSSGSCWNNAYSGDSGVITTLAPYFSNGAVPKPVGTQTGESRHDSYLYAPGPVTIGTPAVTGSFVVWAQEKPITDCNGYNAGQIETGIYYCYEKLP